MTYTIHISIAPLMKIKARGYKNGSLPYNQSTLLESDVDTPIFLTIITYHQHTSNSPLFLETIPQHFEVRYHRVTNRVL